MEGWTTNQLELFAALSSLCSKVGDEGAAEITQTMKSSSEAFVKEWTDLRAKAGKREATTEGLEKQARIHGTGALLHIVPREEVTYASSSVQTDPVPENGHSAAGRNGNGSYRALVTKYNVVVKNHQELSVARNELENRVRKKRELEKRWVNYANSLERKIGRLEGVLASNGISGSCSGMSRDTLLAQPVDVSSSGVVTGLSSSKSIDIDLHLMDPAPSASSLDLPTTRRTSRNLVTVLSANVINDCAAISFVESDFSPAITPDDMQETLGLPIVTRGLTGSWKSIESSKSLTNTRSVPGNELGDPHSGSTEEDMNATVVSQGQLTPAPVFIKPESPSDNPVVISSRSVRNKRNRKDATPENSVKNTKVKAESVTSSPIGLAGAKHFFPQDNVDLDDIGERFETPKKKRQFLSAAAIQHDNVENRYVGNLSALQPTSPNKQILPRVIGIERQTKRQRLHDRTLGPSIYSEDGENGSIQERVGNHEAGDKAPRKRLPADIAGLEQRLNGLHEKASLQRSVITKARPSNAANTAAHRHIKGTPTDSLGTFSTMEQPANFVRRENGNIASRNRLRKSVGTPINYSKMSTAKRAEFKTPQNISPVSGHCRHFQILRSTPVQILELSDFKVNPNVNQGFDFAFADVVRGREQRKCLPGCTKPECCGDKFRKFVEMTKKTQGHQTASQEEEDERLLENYMGDNRGRLRTMTKSEKSELVIQAKTRELAQKAGKHRHAYERRRSPPGFWRTDFPNTQEVEADREEAARVERQLVQERYEEAMRPGGRWIFRDE